MAVVRKESFANCFTIKIAFKGPSFEKKKKQTKLKLKLTEKIDELIYMRGNCLDSVCIMFFFIVSYCKFQSRQVESFIAVQ